MESAVQDRRNGGSVHEEETTEKAKLNPEFIKNLNGRDFVRYVGLLDLSHKKGLIKLDVEIIQYPTKENGNEAICRAVAETMGGGRFSDIGDASPLNTDKPISAHILRMASTRAKARALRDLTNIGMTCLEELGDLDEVLGEKKEEIKRSGVPADSDHDKVTETKRTSSTESRPITPAQRKAIVSMVRKRKIDEPELAEILDGNYGVSSVDLLTLKDASLFIKVLQSQK